VVVLRQAREPLHSRERQPWVFRRPALAAAIEDLNDRRRVEWKALGWLVAVSYEGGHISPVESRRADPSVVEGDNVAPLPVLERVVLPEQQVLGVAQVEPIAIEGLGHNRRAGVVRAQYDQTVVYFRRIDGGYE